MIRPVLDQKPIGTSHDWQLSRIQVAKAPLESIIVPDEWENPLIKKVALKDQGFRGTCTGFATASAYDLLHLMLCPDDMPTAEEMAKFKMDVTEPTGTIHDILFDDSASNQWFYTIGREEGNITYPSGGDIKFCARAWNKRGMILERDWFTDKTGRFVIVNNPNPELEQTFAPLHKCTGWAMIGNGAIGGNMTEDDIKRAIFTKGFAILAIPVCKSFTQMEGGDGWFEQVDENDGFHAILAYGYSSRGIKLFHSWGKYCNPYGGMTWQYFHALIDQIVGLVIIDDADVKIGREIYTSLTITTNVPAMISVNGVNIGPAPQTIALEKGQKYTISARADGFYVVSTTADENVKTLVLTLEALPAPRPKSWWALIIEFIARLFQRG